MDHIVGETHAIGAKNGKRRGKGISETNAKGRREANWSDEENGMLLELLCEVQCRKQNPYGDGGYNDHEWSYVYGEFTKRNTQTRLLPSLKLRWKNLKCDFSFFRCMANRSGCGWNNEAHVPDVPEDAWIHIKERDPTRYKRYVKKTFPWYQQMEILYGKNIASGRSNVTTDPSRPIPHTFDDGYSSSDDINDTAHNNDTAHQEIDEFSIHEFQQILTGNIEQNLHPIGPRTCVDEPEQNLDPIRPRTCVDEPVHVPTHVVHETIHVSTDNLDGPMHVPMSNIHELPNEPVISTTSMSVPAPCTQNRKRGNNSCEGLSRRTKSKGGNSRMEEFAERFLQQQQERTQMIAQLGQSNNIIQDQVFEKLKSLALPMKVHIDMEMSLGNSWVRGCFAKEEDKECLMYIVERAIALLQAGQLSLNH